MKIRMPIETDTQTKEEERIVPLILTTQGPRTMHGFPMFLAPNDSTIGNVRHAIARVFSGEDEPDDPGSCIDPRYMGFVAWEPGRYRVVPREGPTSEHSRIGPALQALQDGTSISTGKWVVTGGVNSRRGR